MTTFTTLPSNKKKYDTDNHFSINGYLILAISLITSAIKDNDYEFFQSDLCEKTCSYISRFEYKLSETILEPKYRKTVINYNDRLKNFL